MLPPARSPSCSIATRPRRLTGSPRYYGAWHHPEGGHLNPLGYARGLARAVIRLGGVVHTDLPVQAIMPSGTRWRVETPRGAVLADKVICGTGAYTDGYWPGLESSFQRMTVAIMATQPLGDNVRKTIAPSNHTVVETRADPMIYKYNKEGRLVTSVFVEGRRGGDVDYTKQFIGDKLKWLLPQLDEVDFQYYWTGELDMQPKTFPRLFELAPGVLASLGYSGRGVPTGTMMGARLVRLGHGHAARGPDAAARAAQIRAALHEIRAAHVPRGDALAGPAGGAPRGRQPATLLRRGPAHARLTY